MSWNHYDHLYNCPFCGKLLSDKRMEDDEHVEKCKKENKSKQEVKHETKD